VGFLNSLFYVFSFDSSLLLAGPFIGFPELAEKREPWQGQSNDFSKLFHVTIQPKWVHDAE
jgi:hypothetical protein